jgi:hypothetical protein
VKPSLSDESQRVLRVIVRKPVITGGELMVLAHMDANQLADAVRPLVSAYIISTNTSSLDPNEIIGAYFNLNPSARQYAESAAT